MRKESRIWRGSAACKDCLPGAQPSPDRDFCVCSVGMFAPNATQIPLQCEVCPRNTICSDENVALESIEVSAGVLATLESNSGG